MKTLYLGLDVSEEFRNDSTLHYPIIQTVPRSRQDIQIIHAFKLFNEFTELLFTSKVAVDIFFDYAKEFKITTSQIESKSFIAVGKKTANQIRKYTQKHILIPKNETAEGIIDTIQETRLKNRYFFWPHSSLSRPLLIDWFQAERIEYFACVFYDTIPRRQEPLPDYNLFDAIVFTSPSTIDAFLSFYSTLPIEKKMICIGPVTSRHLQTKVEEKLLLS